MRHEHLRHRHNPRRRPREERVGLRIEGFGAPGLIHIGTGLRGARSRRGDVRAAILLLLAEEPMHGYQVIQQIADRSQGDWKPSPGSVYPTMSALEDEGLITITQVDGRKTARLTAAGSKHVHDHRAALGNPFDTTDAVLGNTVRDLRRLLRLVNTAVGQVAAVAAPGQLEQAAAILSEARTKLYRLLAEEAGETGRP